MTDPTVDDAIRLVRRLARLMRGRAPPTQGAALADLLATWLAGHIVRGDPAATDQMREMLLTEHIEVVRKLIPLNATSIHGPDA